MSVDPDPESSEPGLSEGQPADPSRTSAGSVRVLAVWTVLAVCMLAVALGRPALIEPDEGRNATIAAEMARTGDFVVPRLEGLPYLDKPVLFFALIAGSLELFGKSEWAVRLPALLASWATVALVGWFGASVLGRRAGLVAALATATTPLFLAFARTAIFDSTLTLWIVAALVSFYWAVEADGRKARGWRLAAWAAVALGVLTKGPVALLPLLVAVPWAIRRRGVHRIVSLGSILVFLAVVVPWVVAVEREVPGFLRYVLVTETWQRVASDALQRSEPWWFFVPFVLAGFFPWSVVGWSVGRGSGSAVAGSSRELLASLRLFLWLWIVLPFLLFSLASSKQPQYVLPLAPACALLVASGWGGRAARRGAIAGAVGWTALAVPLLLVGLRVIPVDTGVDAETSAGIYRTGVLLAVAALAASVGTVAVLARRSRRTADLALVALSLPLVLFPWITSPSLAEIAEIRSSRGVARAFAERLRPGDRLIGVESYSPSLSFYLGSGSVVSSEDAAPFRSNFVLDRYQRLVDPSAGALRPGGWWREALAGCLSEVGASAPRTFFFVDRSRSDAGAELEAAGLEPFHSAFRIDAYGPCGAKGGR